MKYLIFADLHSFDADNLNLIVDSIDVLLFLGDIKVSSILKIRQMYPNKPAFGVLGNHDDLSLFHSANKQIEIYNKFEINMDPIVNMHCNCVNFETDIIAGLQGCVGYKDSGVMMTQEEANSLKIPCADILISHETGYHYMKPVIDTSHEGFEAVLNYILKEKPKFHLFGHHHKNIQFQKEDTMCFCIYGCSIFDSASGSIKNIF
ncbi:metallophosphoesterase family protein [Lacrimispora amygdalina]|uniref:metallophosphoesterase family protein n=1 Tax=Lacrimispora amygdalina TaxID=253257 RepID=UPI000BE485D0|nr:metallophosphoesterase family protein [Lacrimispora amygdalina]